MSMIISDSGPLIIFSRVNRLGILRDLFRTLVIPQAVYIEIVEEGKDLPGAKEIRNAKWIEVVGVKSFPDLILPDFLGKGEREAIFLARQTRGILLMDEKRARNVAKQMGLKVFGSLGVLLKAKSEGKIDSVKTLLDEFIQNGYYISKKIYRDILTCALEL